jgi:hypothetical protein
MSKTSLHAAALALAVAATAGTFAATDALAKQEYVASQRLVLAAVPVSTPRTVVVVSRRRST